MINECTKTYKCSGRDDVDHIETKIAYDRGEGYRFSIHDFKEDKLGRTYHFRMSLRGMGFGAWLIRCNRQSKKRYEEAKAMMPELEARFLDAYCDVVGLKVDRDSVVENERDRYAA